MEQRPAYLVIPGKLTIPMKDFKYLKWYGEPYQKMYMYYDTGLSVTYIDLTPSETQVVEEQLKKVVTSRLIIPSVEK